MIIPMLCVTIFVILVVWFLLPRVARLMIHTPTAISIFVCLAIDSTVDIFTFYVPHRHVYGEQWIKFMKDGVNATPLPTVNTTGYIDHAAFLGTINPDTNKIPKHL